MLCLMVRPAALRGNHLQKTPESHLNTTENSPRQTRAHVLQNMLPMSVCVTNTKVRLNICVHFTGVVIIYIYTLLQQSLHSCCSHKHTVTRYIQHLQQNAYLTLHSQNDHTSVLLRSVCCMCMCTTALVQ